jgi:ActR/RegA family two-component response regulator
MQELQRAIHEASVIPSHTSAIGLPLVLVADADAGSRVRRARQLATRGFRVAVARTAFEAIVKASCYVPDLIVIDTSLGDSGVEETVELLSTCPATAHIPVVRLRGGRRLPARLVSHRFTA